MVLFKGIRANILRFDDAEPYPEWKQVPGAHKCRRNEKNIFIEVVTGERFSISIEVTPNFDFKSYPDVEIGCNIDGVVEWAYFVSAEAVKRSKRRGAEDKRKLHWHDHVQKVDSEWTECGLVFADLNIDESVQPSDDQVAQDLDKCGTVLLSISRGKAVKCKPTPWGEERVVETKTSSKEVVKKNHVSNVTTFPQLEKCEQPNEDYVFEEAPGKEEMPINIRMRYRSRDALQILGVISKDPEQQPAAPLKSAATRSTVTTGTKRKSASTQLINDEDQPPARKIKQEIGAKDPNPNANIKHEFPVSSIKNGTKDNRHSHHSISTAVNAPTRGQPTATGATQVAAPVAIKDEDNLQILDFRPAPRLQAAATPAAAAPVTHGGEQADRERKKTLLKLRLEQLKIVQELMEMGD